MELQKQLRLLLIKMDITKLPAQEKLVLLNQLEKEEKELTSLFGEVKEADPYWWYKPSDGELSPNSLEFLKKWIDEGSKLI